MALNNTANVSQAQFDATMAKWGMAPTTSAGVQYSPAPATQTTAAAPTPAQAGALAAQPTNPVVANPVDVPAPVAAQAAAPQALVAQDATMAPGGSVANNVSNLIDQNSPLMQRAAARAMDQANGRGLLNSSIAAGAAQGAVMDAATPIAAQDASAQNQMTLQNAQQANAMASKNADLQSQNQQFNTGQTNQFNLQDYVSKADRQTKELVANLDANTKTLVQSSASASASFMSYMDSIQKVQNGTGTAAQKTADIQSLFRGMQDTMAILGAIGGLKTTDGQPISSLLQDPTQV